MPTQFTYRTTSFSCQNKLENTSVFHSSFSGKEKDLETGYHYFGARYYNSDLSLWLSVDPMAEKYPSLSPYNYCAWNPMKLVDPNGDTVVFKGEAERMLYHKYIQMVFGKEKYAHIQKELHAIESSDETFCIRMGENISNTKGAGNFTYNVETGQLDINISDDARWTDIEKISHELKHADQYLNRKIGFAVDWKGSAIVLGYDRNDELEAFSRQGLFGNTMSPEEVHTSGTYKNLSTKDLKVVINPEYIETNRSYIETNHLTRQQYIYSGWKKDLTK